LCYADPDEDDPGPAVLLGIRLACEMHAHDRNFDTCLGVVVLKNQAWLDFTLPTVRDEICSQLHAVPDSFLFLTAQG
jgi:hypothetical protein